MRRDPSPLGAALRSILIPGWGQLVTNRTAAGKVLVFCTGLTAIGALTVVLFVEPLEVAAWLVNPDVILGIILFNVMLLVVRLLSTELAWRARGGHRWFAAIFLGLIVSIPHVAIGWVGLETRDSLLRIFPEPPAQVAAAEPATATTTTTMIQVELSPIVSAPGQFGVDEIDATPTAGWRPFGEERLNVLLLGGDAGPGRTGLRTDTMMVASINPVTGDAALIGLPRNYGGITLRDGTPIPVTQLGHVYGWGRGNPDQFPSAPDPGAAAVSEAFSTISGLDIDYYVLVDLTGFADVVDAFGGVRMEVSEPVDGPLYDVATGGYEMVHIPAGSQQLDGAHALAYSRARYGSSDYVRMGRQRCVLASMAADADPLTLVAGLGDLMDAVESNLSTNIPMDLIPELILLTPRVSVASIRMIGFDSTWGLGLTAAGRAIPDIARIREAVRETIENPASAERFGATTAADGC